jgi:hypothetical protein
MSFYLGADNNGNNILHITKGTNNLADMQNGIIDSSVYHSDMVFVNYEEFDITRIVSTGYFCRTGRFVPPYVQLDRIFYPDLDTRAVELLREGRLFMLVDDTYTQVANNAGSVFASGWYGCVSNYNLDAVFYTSVICGDVRYSYDDPKTNALGITGKFSKTPTKILIFNVKHDGTFVDLYPSTSNEIVLNKEEISVNGVDLSSLRYLQNKQYVGSTPISTINAGTIYKVAPPNAGNFYLDVTESGTTIKRGNEVIIDSRNPPVSNHVSTVIKHSINVDTGDNYTLNNIVNLGSVTSYLGKTVLISVNCLQSYKGADGAVYSSKDLVTTSVTALNNNEVISLIAYQFAFGRYYNATAFYGSFNQLVLRIVDGTLFIAGKTSRYPYNVSGVSYTGGYEGRRLDLKLTGEITLCIL